MSSTTPNLGLTKTTAAETIGQNWAASNDSGGNFDIIDTKMGAVGSTSLQAQVTALNSKIARTQLTITRTENAIVSASELARCSANRCGKTLVFVFNCTLSGANTSDFVEIGTIAGWSASNDTFAAIMPQSGEMKPVIVQVQATGKIRVYGSQGTAYSFYRGNLTAPEY